MSEANGRKWEAYDTSTGWTIRKENNVRVCDGMRKGDALLVVRAVNSHDLAVELANKVLTSPQNVGKEMLSIARAFLQAAKGE